MSDTDDIKVDVGVLKTQVLTLSSLCNKMDQVIFECEICQAKYKSRSGLWKHTSTHHSGNVKSDDNTRSFSCSKCNRKFSTKCS